MIIYCHNAGPRLRYVASIISIRLTGQEALLTADQDRFSDYAGLRINYSDTAVAGQHLQILPSGILFDEDIRSLETKVSVVRGRKALFTNSGDFGFDLFAATFYLLSRYEEYLPHQKDGYGRFRHNDSVAYRHDFLDEPLVDEWIIDLARFIRERSGEADNYLSPLPKAEFLPTYDIDEPWSFRHKDRWISAGGMIKDLLKGNFGRVRERRMVRRGMLPDPFDAYHWMDDSNRNFRLDPVYFFLVAAKRSRYDRNISPVHPAFIKLMRETASKYKVGLHPSWQSSKALILQKEKKTLEEVTGQPVHRSRQHFIRFDLPATFRELIAAGISEDYSMGYGSVNGFRASTSYPYPWYDLQKDEPTPLHLVPFCFMDANCFFEAGISPSEAGREMRSYYEKVKKTGGQFVSIWHNTFLGTDPLFAGWRETYLNFLQNL